MALSPSNIFLYAADAGDYANAESIAGTYGLPFGNVTGSFAAAWTAVASGKFLVIAVGAQANDALYYNPSGWAGLATGTTPFSIVSGAPVDTLPGKNLYENAAGTTGTDTMEIATDYVEYALGKSMTYTPIPSVKGPADTVGGVNPAYGT